ncbi:hypothetical protein [Helicobacter pylori]|uniref:Uncharacterized protein n=1 Tax=Helicobacter pylori GAM260BSi TaxID=1159046 RepID=M3QQE9_HELPX|nr:hypothetical protein [Helicobacter pylori]EMH22626.1 hypothetical protein HMPREF1418_01068 [Helicobacter pylori GAM260BSi]EMH65902.1 hypothetical protein HMPREF1451_01640 [Helicobacter pylori HP260BFii]
MNTNNKNKNASHLTHEMKKEHGGLVEASMEALMGSKCRKLADIRAKISDEKEKQLEERDIQLEIKEKSEAQGREFFTQERESFKREKESVEREKKLMQEEFQAQRELLEIYYGYPTQKNKPGIKYDDTIDIEPEDEKG